MLKRILIGFIILISTNLFGQEKEVQTTVAVQSIDGIVNEVLNIISIQKGGTIDTTALRNLFLPTANFSVHTHNYSIPSPVETVTLNEFLELLKDPYYEEGFLEYEISKVVDEYNGIAQVFQTYFGKDSEDYEERGITSYQLVYFNKRWWIANTLWTGDSNGVRVPEKYLGK